MLPNVAKAVKKWASPYTSLTVDKQTVDFVEADVITSRTINALVQVADKSKLQTDKIDWFKNYLLVHSLDVVTPGEYIEYEGADYKIISVGPWTRFGCIEAIAEETKKTKLVVTPVP